MAETTINQAAEIPSDYAAVFTAQLEQLKHINHNIEQNREEIDFLETETRKRLNKINQLLDKK